METEGQQWYTFTPAYQSIVSGAKASVIHRTHSQRHSWALTFTSEHDSSAIAADVLTDPSLRDELIALGLDPRTGEQDGTLNAVGVDARFNGVDNILNARRGYQLAVRLEQAGKVVPGTYQYFGASVDSRHIPAGRLVIANRVQIGSVASEGSGTSTIPFSKRLFLGGATSIRGWGRYEVSPLSGSGLPLGGESLFAWSSEIRVPLTDRFGAVGVVDAGNVWADPWTISLADLRYAIGPGLRYLTPIGPVRFDVGFSNESYSQSAGERRAATATVASPFQHRSGLLASVRELQVRFSREPEQRAAHEGAHLDERLPRCRRVALASPGRSREGLSDRSCDAAN